MKGNKTERRQQPARENLTYKEQDQLEMVCMIRKLKREIKVGEIVLGHKVVSISKNFIVVKVGGYRDTHTWQELYEKGVKR